jgi:hypothetical protein
VSRRSVGAAPEFVDVPGIGAELNDVALAEDAFAESFFASRRMHRPEIPMA